MALSERVTVELPPDLKAQIDAVRGRIPFAVIVREALAAWVEAQKKAHA